MSKMISDKQLIGLQVVFWILSLIATLAAFENSSYVAACLLSWLTLWLCVIEDNNRYKARMQRVMSLWISNLQREKQS